ncbi:hypothetical protein [Fodinibius saliphilus]|uniref:hypothetical protein n=1 Tax=Fodinibius saliphilus TaxID=1920650 RepID=UPI001485E032|nr:hypothetical protein [Fodinibius saliphilus]
MAAKKNNWIEQLVLAILFYVIITPTGLILRLFGYDPLRLKSDKDNTSYWVKK